MAIELIPKQEIRKSVLKNALFYAALLLLLIVVFAYLALFYWAKKTSQTIEDLNYQLIEMRTEEIKEMEKTVLTYQKKINLWGQLIDSHKYPLNFFTYLESLTHPRVYFRDFSLDVEQLKVEVSGNAESFTALGQQVLIFQGADLFKNVDLSAIGIGEEAGADFSIDFSVSNEIFKPLEPE